MSVALEEWRGPSAWALDEIELLHQLVEDVWGSEVELTQQITYLYATLILAHFQRYCRSVHTEAAQVLVVTIADPALASVVKGLIAQNRYLDRGNPSSATLSGDFGRLGFEFWPTVEADDAGHRERKRTLEHICEWRNGITHGDIARKRSAGRLVPPDLEFETCRDWRRSLGALVGSIDRVLARQCQDLGCQRPW